MLFEGIETGFGLNWFKVDKYLRPDRCRPVFPSPVRFFPKKEISEDRSSPGLVQKRLKNRTGPDLETLLQKADLELKLQDKLRVPRIGEL